MTLPTFDITKMEDGGSLMHYAGKDILNQLRRKNIVLKIIIITQYDYFGEGSERLTRNELDFILKNENYKHYLGMVYFSVTQVSWKSELKKLMAL
jgi:hypothetical protein